jgi:structural maintenance of chromosomes protein 5
MATGYNKSQKDVEKLNAQLNIQLNNLCQFLPQEKVVEFSKMTPTELLVSTERAIGDARLAEMHETLISGGKDLHEQQNERCAPSLLILLCTLYKAY